MLLLNDKKILIFTPNKCASTSVTETLLKMGAVMVLGPQGPYKSFDCDSFDDGVGKHSMCVPYWCKNWRKFLIVRNPYDRFISLWRHYCKYSDHEVGLEQFISIVEGFKKNPPKGWFYTQRMDDFIRQAPSDTELIDTTQLGALANILSIDEFPKLHTTEHGDYRTYYTPALYRKVYDLA